MPRLMSLKLVILLVCSVGVTGVVTAAIDTVSSAKFDQLVWGGLFIWLATCAVIAGLFITPTETDLREGEGRLVAFVGAAVFLCLALVALGILR